MRALRALNMENKPYKVTKRKVLEVPDRIIYESTASVDAIRIEDIILESNSKRFSYFKRLKYKGCPPIDKVGQFIDTELIDMGRDDFIRSMYQIMQPIFNTSWENHFRGLIVYIRWMDEFDLLPIEDDYFHPELMKAYFLNQDLLIQKGIIKSGTRTCRRSSISSILKQMGRHTDSKKLPPSKIMDDVTSYKGLDIQTELKPTAQALFRSFFGFVKHFKEGTVPTIHPIFDEKQFLESNLNLSVKQLADRRSCFKRSVSKVNNTTCVFETCTNQMTRYAITICHMFTGINTTPLLNMKRRDVKFKIIGSGKYIFDTIKYRADGKKQDNGFGFSKYGKEFIDTWIQISKDITGDHEDALLFPCIKGGKVISFIGSQHNIMNPINQRLKDLGLTTISASTLRKTKFDTLIKVTEDIYLVSLSANNEITTIIKHYSNGLDKDHERNLTAGMDAQYQIGKGTEITLAVKTAKEKYKDVLSEYDVKRLRISTKRTVTGIRCGNKGDVKDIISRELNSLKIDIPEKEKLCTDFLACFECQHHVLIASVDDIWLMLSFFDVLKELKEIPTLNSLPKKRFYKIEENVKSILNLLKDKSQKNYQIASRKNSVEPHPLYSDVHSLNDLIEVF